MMFCFVDRWQESWQCEFACSNKCGSTEAAKNKSQIPSQEPGLTTIRYCRHHPSCSSCPSTWRPKAFVPSSCALTVMEDERVCAISFLDVPTASITPIFAAPASTKGVLLDTEAIVREYQSVFTMKTHITALTWCLSALVCVLICLATCTQESRNDGITFRLSKVRYPRPSAAPLLTARRIRLQTASVVCSVSFIAIANVFGKWEGDGGGVASTFRRGTRENNYLKLGFVI